MTPRMAIGLDLGGTDLKSGLVGADGSLTSFSRRPSRTLESAEGPFEAIAIAVEELRAGLAATPVAAGLGCPGVIHPERGELVGTTAHLPHWDSTPLRAELERRLGIAFRLDNDANLAALAESRLGAARGTRVSMTVTLGTGIGCGIVVEGRVLRGALGGAGEIGHLPLGDGRHPCRCGVPGCIEPEASASGLVRAAREHGLDLPDAAAVFAAAGGGNPVAERLVERMTDRLGVCIAAAVDLIQPEVVVLGGGVSAAGAALVERVHAAVIRYALSTHTRALRVVGAGLGPQAGVVGAGLLAWEANGAG
jgi:glucokinase